MAGSKKTSKRPRINFSEEQLKGMEDVFSQTQYPDVTVLELLADRLQLPMEKICTWFQNRRSKFRRESKKGHINWMRKQLYDNTETGNDVRQSTLSPPPSYDTSSGSCSPVSSLNNNSSVLADTSSSPENPTTKIHYFPGTENFMTSSPTSPNTEVSMNTNQMHYYYNPYYTNNQQYYSTNTTPSWTCQSASIATPLQQQEQNHREQNITSNANYVDSNQNSNFLQTTENSYIPQYNLGYLNYYQQSSCYPYNVNFMPYNRQNKELNEEQPQHKITGVEHESSFLETLSCESFPIYGNVSANFGNISQNSFNV